MSTAAVTKQVSENKAAVGSRIVGAYYLLTVLTGISVLVSKGRFAFAVDVFLGVFYLVVTAFLYGFSTRAKEREEGHERIKFSDR